jgi:hypothetical protein
MVTAEGGTFDLFAGAEAAQTEGGVTVLVFLLSSHRSTILLLSSCVNAKKIDFDFVDFDCDPINIDWNEH